MVFLREKKKSQGVEVDLQKKTGIDPRNGGISTKI